MNDGRDGGRVGRRKGPNPFEPIYVRLVSTGILAQGGAGAPWVALVSRLPGEGVTTVALGLAEAAAEAGHAMLVLDASPAGERAAAKLRLSAPVLAATDGKLDAARLEAAITPTGRPGVDLLTVADAELSGHDFAPLRDRLRARYAAVLVDCGSLASEIPHRWRPAVDHVLLVLDPERATYESLERFRTTLAHSTMRLSGFVMNRRRFPVPSLVYRLAT